MSDGSVTAAASPRTATGTTTRLQPCRAWLTALLASVALLPTCALAEIRALLVGVSEYPTLAARAQLQGPRNDVEQFRSVLLQRGVLPQHIVVLADGWTGAPLPTRHNIMRAIDQLVESARAGDTVILHFAGHGSQQPADRNTPEGRTEPDGLHEIFLPRDVGRWDPKSGRVVNAIIDHELRARVDRMQVQGAFVWGVFDACHSASLVRGRVGDKVLYRQVPPPDLGIEQNSLDAARDAAARSPGAGAAPHRTAAATPLATEARAGGAVFFYAAQTTEVTPELPLPLDAAQRRTYGLFSFMVSRALALNVPMTYRQLAQYVLSQYAAMAEARVTPVFSGESLDQVVLGQQLQANRQWPVRHDDLTLPVGSLSGLAQGAEFALLPDALSRPEQAVGYLRARQVQLAQTVLEPVALRGKPAPGPSDFAPGAQARLLSNPVRLSLRVGVDAEDCGTPCVWEPALAKLRTAGVPEAEVQWVADAEDVVLELTEDAVAIISPTQPSRFECEQPDACRERRPAAKVLVRRNPATGDLPAAAQALGSALHAVARSINLMRLASQLALAAPGNSLKVTVQVRAAGSDEIRSVTPESVPLLRPRDLVTVTLDNRGNRPVDVTVLYADARFGIGALYPASGEVNRLEPRATYSIDDIVISDKDGIFGIERLLVIGIEAEPRSERADLSFLSQPSLRSVDRTATRGLAAADELQAFMDAGFADHRTRGQAQRVPSHRTTMQIFTFHVLDPSSRR